MTPFNSPRLIADIGGTYARFALEISQSEFTHIESLLCAEHADFHAAVSAYLRHDRPGRAAQRKSYLWAQMSGSGPPIRLFTYAASRSAQTARQFYDGARAGR